MDYSRPLLGTVDYVIFGLMLFVSAGIGVYFRFSGGQQRTTEEYLLAGKDMSLLPVAFSLMASFLSAITVIGIPAEMYRFGIHMAYMNIGYVTGMTLTAYLTLPVYFELQASTAYEYLDRRFGTFARILTSIAFVLQMILYMSVVLYAPALALSAVTNMSIWVSVISIGVVCTFYCTLGGMKAVLWTDVFQAVLMFLGMFAVLIKGLIDMGFTEVYTRAKEGGRLPFPGLSANLTERYTVWNLFVQGVVLSMIAFGGNQVQVQRLMTVKNITRARLALYVSIPMGVSFHLLNCLAGIIIYAWYAQCDPITAPDAPISSADQLLPYYMMSALGAYPGLPGLCICGIFSASLSTVSSAVNSLTAVTMQDLVKPFLEARGKSQKNMAFSAKAITLFYGFLCVALTFLVATFGNLIQASLTVFGMLGGPVLAVFFLGMLTTKANEKGAVIGLLSGIAISAWVSFGASSHAPHPKWLPVSTDGCLAPNSTHNSTWALDSTAVTSTLVSLATEAPLTNHTFAIDAGEDEDIFPLYRISYMWFSSIGLLSSVIIGYIASLIINNLQGETKDVPLEFISPLVRRFMKKKDNLKEKEVKNGHFEPHKSTEMFTIKGAMEAKAQTQNTDIDVQTQNGGGDINSQTQNGDPDVSKVQNQNGDSNITESVRF